MPLLVSGTQKRQFQPAKKPGQFFLLLSLKGEAIAMTHLFLYQGLYIIFHGLENMHAALLQSTHFRYALQYRER